LENIKIILKLYIYYPEHVEYYPELTIYY